MGLARRLLNKVSATLVHTEKALNTLYRARDGGVVSKALALSSLAGQALNIVWPPQSLHEELLAQGYSSVHLSSMAFVARLLEKSDLPREVAANGPIASGATAENSARVLYFAERQLALVYDGGKFGLYTKHADVLADCLGRVVWRGSDVLLDVRYENAEGDVPTVSALGEPGAFVGTPSVEWFVQRLRVRDAKTRSLMLVGPTGIGKSTIARLIARHLHPERPQTLKIARKVSKALSTQEIIELVLLLRPTMVLVDDFQAYYHDYSGDNDQSALEIIEMLHGKVPLIIFTWMNDHYDEDRGSHYRDGLRPGRIDEVVLLKRPDSRQRAKILQHYLTQQIDDPQVMADIAKLTIGMTGAYLAELAQRINYYGIKNYKREIRSLRAAAPEERRAIRRRRAKIEKQLDSMLSPYTDDVASSGDAQPTTEMKNEP